MLLGTSHQSSTRPFPYRDAEERGGNFNGRPYFRMCIGFLNELSPADPADEGGWRYLQARGPSALTAMLLVVHSLYGQRLAVLPHTDIHTSCTLPLPPLQAMATFLYATRTLAVPSFAFPWLQLLADKRFLPKLLMAPAHRGWPAFLQLLVSQVRGRGQGLPACQQRWGWLVSAVAGPPLLLLAQPRP